MLPRMELNACFHLSEGLPTNMYSLAYLHPVGLPEASADTGSKGPSGYTADHDRHALLTGPVALQLDLSAQLTVGQFGLVARAVDRVTPVVLLTAFGQQPEWE